MTISNEIPQAGSPETQALVEACFQSDWAALGNLLPPRRRQAEQALDSFLGQADSQGEEFLRAHDASLQRVEDAFGFYGEALDRIQAAASSRSEEQAREGGRALASASLGIRSAVVAYEESYLSYGDSRFPLVNLLTNLGERVRGGEVSPEVWQATCGRYEEFYRKGVEEIDESEESQKPGVPERRAALDNMAIALEKAKALTPKDSRDSYENLFFEISGQLVELSEAFETYHTQVFLTGESESPRVNLILNVARGTLEGRYDRSILRALTEPLLEEIEGRLKELQRLAEEPLDSAALNDSIADMIDVLESMADALYLLNQLANGEEVDQGEIQEALDLLLESGDTLGEVNQAVAGHNERLTTVTCPACGAKQERGQQACGSCRAPLPQAPGPITSSFEMHEGPGEGEFGEPVMTTVMQELFTQADDFDAARLNAQQFSEAVEAHHQKIDQAEEQLFQLQVPTMPEGLSVEDRALCREFITIAEDGLALLEVGLAECREALDHFQQFAETREKELKDRAKQLYHAGTQKMWLVKRAQEKVDSFIKASAAFLPPDGPGAAPGQNRPSATPSSLTSRFQDHL